MILGIFRDELAILPGSSLILAIFRDELAILPGSSLILAVFRDEFPTACIRARRDTS